MPISYAVIVPHPPIIVPEVGGSSGIKPVETTINAMLKVSLKIAEVKPETIVIITPHGPIYPDRPNIRIPKNNLFSGTLWQFGASNTGLKLDFDRDLAAKIINTCESKGISLWQEEDDNLDHGVLAPMYYLTKAMPKKPKLVSLNISLQGYKKHFELGQAIAEAGESFEKPILFVASGDLSHRLTKDAPAGYNPQGKRFDEKLVECLKEDRISEILDFDPFFADEAGECGLRSIDTLLGVIAGLNFKKEFFSYEGPYGVGYLVMGFRK